MDEPRNLVVRLSRNVSDIVQGALSEAPARPLTTWSMTSSAPKIVKRRSPAVLRKIEEAENDPRPR